MDVSPPPIDKDMERIRKMRERWQLLLIDRAAQLWAPDYQENLLAESMECPRLREQVLEVFDQQKSSYRVRLKDKEKVEQYDQKTLRCLRDTAAVMRRRRSMHDIPFSVMARSISYFNQRVPFRVWRDQQRGLRIVARETVQKTLDCMLDVAPKLPWLRNECVSVFCLDQCNHWQASKNSRRGHFRGSERLDSDGMPVTIRNETVVNVVERHLPFVTGMLLPHEVAQITLLGPYTEDFRNVYIPLEPMTVKAEVSRWLDRMLMPVRELLRESSAPTEKDIAEVMLARPPYHGGKTHVDFLPTIPNCDTKAFKDVFKFFPILLARCALSVCCVVIYGDGQTVEILRACKRRWPTQYKNVLIANGYFHAFVHFIFCVHEGFWYVCLATFAKWLHKRKQIYRHFKNLEHDNAKHSLDFHRVCASAITAWVVLDVKYPPPKLFLRDPEHYISLIQHDGALAALMYLKFAGSPILEYQRTIRGGHGATLKYLVAYSIHCQRCMANKCKSVLINLTSLVGLMCAHPKLRQVLEHSFALSLLGNNLMAFDRFLEYVNNLQLKRNTAFRGYDSQLHFTKYIKPLLHVDTAWKDADGCGNGFDDGIPAFLYNDVAELRRQLKENIGTDLTVRAGNTLWFTGNAVPLSGGDMRERRPWEWLWEVAAGRAGGSDGRRRQHWRRYVQEFLAHTCFRK